MINEKLCEMARLVIFFASPGYTDFLDGEIKTSKCFECEHEALRLSKLKPVPTFS